MGSIRILFADDQLPYNDPVQDNAVKDEICKEFELHRKKPRQETAAGFDDDFDYFVNLLTYLKTERGVYIVGLRKQQEALKTIRSYDPDPEKPDERIDVAVIDLSWWGDSDLASGPENRENVPGFELLDAAQSRFTKNGVLIPTIAYSQNYYKKPSLMGEVLKRGALPIPKINRKDDDVDKRRMGYEALFCAIEHLKNLRPLEESSVRRLATLENIFLRKSKNFNILIFAILIVIAIALLLPAFGLDAGSSNVIVRSLIGVSGGGLLWWAWKDQRAAQADFSRALEKP